MSITNLGTRNNLPSKQLPTDYVKPTVAIFGLENYVTSRYVIPLLKSTVHDSDNIVTMDNIVSAINSAVTVKLANDYIAANTVTAYASLTGLTTNYDSIEGDGDWLSDTAVSYNCLVTVFIKIT